jgi:predicted nucleic acid-binding protein
MKKMGAHMVIDTTVLSNFLQAGCVELLQRLPTVVYACPAVLAEIEQGIRLGKIPPAALEWLLVATLTAGETAQAARLPTRLGLGEAESIAVAHERGWWLATDDRDARRVAAQLRVTITGTVGVLVYCVNSRLVSLEHANELLTRMVSMGYYAPVSRLDEFVQ